MTTRVKGAQELGAQRLGVKGNSGTYRIIPHYAHFRARQVNTGSELRCG